LTWKPFEPPWYLSARIELTIDNPKREDDPGLRPRASKLCLAESLPQQRE
jgi:hypothetical protein